MPPSEPPQDRSWRGAGGSAKANRLLSSSRAEIQIDGFAPVDEGQRIVSDMLDGAIDPDEAIRRAKRLLASAPAKRAPRKCRPADGR